MLENIAVTIPVENKETLAGLCFDLHAYHLLLSLLFLQVIIDRRTISFLLETLKRKLSSFTCAPEIIVSAMNALFKVYI